MASCVQRHLDVFGSVATVIMTVREKLEAYRRKRRREEMMQSIKNTVRSAFSWRRNDEIEKLAGEPTKDEEIQLCEEPQDAQVVEDVEDAWSEDNTQESKNTTTTKVIYFLYFLLWATLYVVALKYQFGAVYFILSALVFICLNTRSRPKQRGELSAYSVFNPNCKAIEGTLDASQFDREIRYGIGGGPIR